MNEASKAVVVFGSNLYKIADLREVPNKHMLAAVGFYLVCGLTLIGLVKNHLYRNLGLVLTVLLGLYFMANKRDYYYHYIASVIPVMALLPALGLGVLFVHGRSLGKAFSLLAAGFLAVSGVVLAYQDFEVPSHYAVDKWLERTKSYVDGHANLVATPGDFEPYIAHVLAKHYFQGASNIGFRNKHHEACQITTNPRAAVDNEDESLRFLRINQSSFFVCQRLPAEPQTKASL